MTNTENDKPEEIDDDEVEPTDDAIEPEDVPAEAQDDEDEGDENGEADVVELDAPDETEEEPEAEPSEVEEETPVVEDMTEDGDEWTPTRLKAAVETLLFTTNQALSIARLRKIVGKVDTRTMRATVSQLQTEYDARSSGLEIVEGPEGFQMCTRPDYASVILRLHRQRKKNPLTATALETLAIVAYKQPITRAEIEMIRGVESSGILRNLSDMGMVKVVGRKEVIGRPQLYGTTTLFLQTFGLRSISDLPSIQRLREQYGDTRSLSERIASADDTQEEAETPSAPDDSPASPDAEDDSDTEDTPESEPDDEDDDEDIDEDDEEDDVDSDGDASEDEAPEEAPRAE